VIEDILRTHPAVTDVVAFGAMGESGIEEISVALVTNRSVSDSHLIDWCAEHGFPLTQIFIVDSLPRTSSGKVHRDLLKRQLLE
jgi:acyl-CoA synthetase (AMP-forming)/AMP-acid ligase II